MGEFAFDVGDGLEIHGGHGESVVFHMNITAE